MTIEKLKLEIEELWGNLNEVEEKIAPLKKQSTRIFKKIQKKKEELDALSIQNLQGFDDKIKYHLHHDGHGESSKKYEERKEFFSQLGIETLGFWPQTNQAVVEISLTKDDSEQYAKTLDTLKKIISHIKPVSGYKRIGISEHTLSEFGFYELLVDDKFHVALTRYGNERIEKSFDTLEDCLTYIQKYHYSNY